MQFERILPAGSGDPLLYTEAGCQPHDPLFDPDEPVLPRSRRRGKLKAAAALLATTLACGGAERTAIHATDSILVQLAPGASPPSRTGSADTGPPIVALASLAPPDEAPLLRVPLQPGDDPAAAAAEMSRHEGVEFAEPVFIYQASRAPNDPRYKDLWGLSAIGAPSAWERTTGDRAVTVAVIDDGVAIAHPDLSANLWVNPDEIAGNGADDDGDGYVDDVNGWDFVEGRGDPSPAAWVDRWHGTHVAGIIGAEGDNRLGVAGVNWKAALMALRALGPQGGRSDDLARAIDFAADHGARVINASWGGGGVSQSLARAIARAGKKGALFVAAAGNGSGPSPDFPADLRFDNVLSAAASTPGDLLATFSNRGALVAAPGVGILSTTAPGQYERYDGTSMASAHVAGVAALLWSAHPGASPQEVRRAMVASAVPMDGVLYGRIDAAGALAALEGTSGEVGPLRLSRDALRFQARPGRIPRAQSISMRAEGGGARAWTAESTAAWIIVNKSRGETPARLIVRVDPSKLSTGGHTGSVVVRSATGEAGRLAVTLQVGSAPVVAVQGDGCALREDGKLHVRAGSGCVLSAADGEAATVQWRLPGGEEVSGARFYGQFVRRGEFQILVSADEGAVDPLPVMIE
jgi:subtilisin family serine protease